MMFIPETIADSLFGSMKLIDDEICYHGSILFTPVNKQIEIIVYTSSHGPTKEQHTLFKEIEQTYVEWVERIPSYIENAFPRNGRAMTTFEFKKGFELKTIIIQDLDKTKATWEVEYITEGLDGWIAIQFTNWEPSSFWFDQ